MLPLLLADPWPAIIAPILLLGVAGIARMLVGMMRRTSVGGDGPSTLEAAAVFIAVVAAVAAAMHGVALLRWQVLPIMRVVGGLLALAGLLELGRGGRSVSGGIYRRASVAFDGSGRTESIMLGLAVTTCIGYLLAAVAPATDADSLDYHLGVPAYWLHAGGAVATPFWLHARLLGIGEALNMLGLACGTDRLGAMLQWTGLPLLFLVLERFATDVRGRVVALGLAVSPPVFSFLVASQKPQLLPAAALCIAFGIVAARGEALTRREISLAALCIGFAIACKSSFLLSGSIATAGLLLSAKRAGQTRFAAFTLLAAFAVLAGPVWLRNLWFYGDPLSPMLERFRSHPAPDVLRFATYLRSYGGGPTWRHLLSLPIAAVVPLRLGDLSTVLGIGAAMWVGLIGSRVTLNRTARRLTGLAIACAVAILAGSQLTPRFFIEPYVLLCAAGLSAGVPRLRVAQAALLVQLGVSAVIAATAAWSLFPGALSRAGRQRVMEASGYGAEAAEWATRTVPAGAVLLTSERWHALLPAASAPATFTAPALTPQEQRDRARAIIAKYHVNTLLVRWPADSQIANSLLDTPLEPLGPSRTFARAVRNPFNRSNLTVTLRLLTLPPPARPAPSP